jgi:hypothetical protein
VNFCEHCGQRLTPDARFCEACGATAVIGDDTASELGNARAGHFDESCLVVINRAGWRARWGHGDATALEIELRKYLTMRSQQSNIAYTVCDVSAHGVGQSPQWREVVAAIKSSIGRRELKFIFLLGGSSDLPMGEYTNPFRDNIDRNVHTDYCYSLLSKSDWGLPESELPTVSKYHVGRLPLGRDTTTNDVRRYFHNASQQSAWPGRGKKRTTGVSAKAWETASEQVFQTLNINDALLHRSPAFSIGEFDQLRSADPCCLFFNVHGGSEPEQSHWTGDDGWDRPIIADAKCFSFESVNVALSEACYGGRFFDPADQEGEFFGNQSILLKAIFDKTIAFVGASKVTFAEADSTMQICFGASDKLAAEFLARFTTESAWLDVSEALGEMMARARAALLRHEYNELTNPSYALKLRKMFLAFNLFGDPTLFRRRGPSNSKFSTSSTFLDTSRDLDKSLAGELEKTVAELHGMLRREVFGRVAQLHQSLRAEIRDGISRSIYSVYPHLRGVQPIETCWQGEQGVVGYLLHYPRRIEERELSVYAACDEHGRLQRILTPK